MNPKMKTSLCGFALFILAMPSPLFASVAIGDRQMSATVRQNDITITCPAQVSYRIEAIPQWESGFQSVKRLTFTDATVTGRTLVCNYSVNNGSARDSSVLMREMPAGYICKNDHVMGSKNWQFLCKRAVAPLRIKAKP